VIIDQFLSIQGGIAYFKRIEINKASLSKLRVSFEYLFAGPSVLVFDMVYHQLNKWMCIPHSLVFIPVKTLLHFALLWFRMEGQPLNQTVFQLHKFLSCFFPQLGFSQQTIGYFYRNLSHIVSSPKSCCSCHMYIILSYKL